ncbi:PGC-1 and ERR-induced regulator in muscle protein 1-like [Lytechinus variegatus]|uniref:PGC-1 and ERR-induced regulator in muscle protein 1-like n=1 Tax=Lytechinus variegatus TaxID=7654 RepID=UPI001BB272D9|nr:PGC-1 and ERR-induced regulator in muscle protein 1-like [Lytechinus variegatus]
MVLSEQNFILFEKVERVLDWKVAGTDRGEGWLTDSTRSPWRPSGNRRGCQAGGLAEEGSTLPVGLPGALYLDCVDVQAGQLPEVATRMPGMPSQDGLGSLAGGQPPPRPTGQGRSRPGCRTCPPRTAGAVERDTAQPSISRPGTQTSRQGSRSSTQRRAGAFERQPAQPSVGQGPAPPDQAAARQLRRWQGLWSDRQPTSSRPGTRTSRPGTRSSTQRRAGAFERDTAHLQSARHPLLEARHPLVNPETGWGPLSDRQPTSSRPGPRSSRRQDVHAKPTLPSKAGTRTSHPTSVGAVKRDTAHKEADRPPQVDARHPLVNSEVGRGFGGAHNPTPVGQGAVPPDQALALQLRGGQGLWGDRQPTSRRPGPRTSRQGSRSSSPRSAGTLERETAHLQSDSQPQVAGRRQDVHAKPTLPLNPPWSLQAIPTGGSRRSGPTAPRLPSPVSRPPSLEFAGDSDRRISTQRADSAPPAEPGLPPAHPGVCRRI